MPNTLEKQPTTDKQSVFDKKTALAIDVAELSRDDFVRLVMALKGYIDDPEAKAAMDERSHKEQVDLSGLEDYDFGRALSGLAVNKLQEVASAGATYLSQQLARGVADSPLARHFSADDRLTQEEILGRYGNTTLQVQVPLFDEAQEAVIREHLIESHQQSAQVWTTHVLDPSNLGVKRHWRNISNTLQKMSDDGRIDFDSATHDSQLLGFVAEGNIYGANYRIWHLIYAMDGEQQNKIKPYDFSMHAFGDVVQGECDDSFYGRFVALEEVDYRDIVANGLHYSPVEFAPGVVAFYEETGHLVEMFDMTHASPDDPGSPKKMKLVDYVRQVFPEYDEDSIENVRGLFYQTGCALESRYVIEQSLGIKLNSYPLDDQIRIVQLLNRATPAQMEAIVPLGREAIRDYAEALEFGDDFGDRLLTIAEHVPGDKLRAVLMGLKQTREGIAGIARWLSDVDAHFADIQQAAVSERVTDLIATIAATAERGAIRINVQPGGGDDGAEGPYMYTADTEQAIKDLSELAANIKKQEGILNDPDTVVTRVVVENDNFSRFRLLNPRLGTMVANIRPYGTRSRGDAQYEIGSYKKGVEASFGLLTNLHDPYGISPHADMRSFSLRFDREGHRPDVSALAPGRQATNQEGTVAADVASIFSFGDPNEPATRIGRAIAAGGRIRSRELGTPDSLNHNMLSDQSYGDADVFAAFAQKVIDKFDAKAKATSRRKLASVAHKLAGLRHHTDYQQAA